VIALLSVHRRRFHECKVLRLAVGPSAARRIESSSSNATQQASEDAAGEADLEERRYNLQDGKIYTFKEFERWAGRVSLTSEEIEDYWRGFRPVDSTGQPLAVPVAPQVEAWRQTWHIGSLERIWTRADFAHVHAVTGAGYALLGALVLLDMTMHDAAALNGGDPAQLPHWVAFVALFLGCCNASSGLQPSLLGQRNSLLKTLGLGTDADLKSGGFVNASIFYLVLCYQALRALPGVVPQALTAPLDVVVGLTAVLAVVHQAIILRGWVSNGSLNGIDAFIVPGVFNLPVAYHLLTEGQAWLTQLELRYPGFPEFFFSANFAIAWSCGMVTFFLSLYDRRVISLALRNLLMLLFPVLVFGAVVPSRAMLMVPELMSNFPALLTLSP